MGTRASRDATEMVLCLAGACKLGRKPEEYGKKTKACFLRVTGAFF